MGTETSEKRVKTGLQIEPFSITLNARQLPEVAGVYARVFAGPEWGEVSRCNTTGRFFPTEVGLPCPCCNVNTAEAYPLNETVEYIKQELSRPHARAWIVRDGEKIVGFSWGFSYESPAAFAEEKYKTQKTQQQVASLLESNGVNGEFYYLSESGVLPDPVYRGQGLGNKFHELRLEVADDLGMPAVQRTSANSNMIAVSRKYMRQIGGPMTESIRTAEGRRIVPMYVIANDEVDVENPNRALFVRP